MKQEYFNISEKELAHLKELYPNMEKNSDVNKWTMEIAKKFLSQKLGGVELLSHTSFYLFVCMEGKTYEYEITGTTDKDIAWNKLKVSNINCYQKLVEGMPLIRITNIGKTDMVIYTLMFGEDFILEPESRWVFSPVKKLVDNGVVTKNPSINDVRNYIKYHIQYAKNMGFRYLILQSGEIHKELNMSRALPTVCNAMKTLGDEYVYEIVSQPLKGKGTKLFIKYKLS